MIKNYLKFVVPVRPDSINKVCQYGKKGGDVIQMKHKWEKIARIYIRRAIVDGELPEYFDGKIGVHFKLFFELERQRDGDNYTLMCKGILDAFVKEGMIEDDNYTHVDDNGRRFAIDKDQSRVEVHIVEKVEEDKSITQNYGEKKRNINSSRSCIRSDYYNRDGQSTNGVAGKIGKNCYVAESIAPEQAYHSGRVGNY